MQFIDDGYTLRASVPVYPGRAFVFEFRPMLRRERQRLGEAMAAAAGDAYWRIADQEVARRIVGDDESLTLRRVRDLRAEDFSAWESMCTIVANLGGDASEYADLANLESGVKLLRKYGHLQGGSTCTLCQQFLFDPEKGELEKDDETGEPIPRFPEAVLACQTSDGCPNGTPSKPLSLSLKNRQAFKHYQECLAVSHFPDDAIVRQNAATIRTALIRSQRRVNHAAGRPVEILEPLYEPARERTTIPGGAVPTGS